MKPKLESRLLLFDYLGSQLGARGSNYEGLSRALKDADPDRRVDGQSHYLSVLESRGAQVEIDQSDLRNFDSNILRYEDLIGRNRGQFRWTYFQYLAALYSEILFHRLATDSARLLADLRQHRNRFFAETLAPVQPSDIRNVAFWMATGSGKTLLSHCNLLQFQHYRPFAADNIVLITPRETLSTQHLEELAQSGIPARHAVTDGLGPGVQVIEITKLYVPDRKSEAPRGGESLPTDYFEGQNLILVDEGHKGTLTKSGEDEERKWRSIREAMTGDLGMALEYSATFAQITEKDDDLLELYGKSILFDYGYRRFWEDGYGKDFSVINLSEAGAYDPAELLLAGLLILYEQHRVFVDQADAITAFNLEQPLMLFVGSTVNTQDAEVLEIVKFLDRVLANEAWAIEKIGDLQDGRSGLPSDLFSHRFPYLAALAQEPAVVYGDLCKRLFHGRGRLTLQMISRADGEIGLRVADAAQDRYCGVINIGNAATFRNTAEDEGIAVDEDDRITHSVFEGIDKPGSGVNLLVGSKKFIEGWSSWRVSVMGLLRVGKSAGPQVIQLFGRGVRLKGKDQGLRRSRALGGTIPQHLHLLETLHVMGLKADYMKTFLEAVRREGIEPPQIRELPMKLRGDIDDLGLQYPDSGDYDFFTEEVAVFDPAGLDVKIDLSPTFAVAAGLQEGMHTKSAAMVGTEALLPADKVDAEAAFLDLLEYKRQRGWFNTYITRAAVAEFLASKVRVIAPAEIFASENERSRGLLVAAARDALHKGLERFVYTQQRRHEMQHLQAVTLDAQHANFPRILAGGGEMPAYRLQVPEDQLKKVDRLIQQLAADKAELENMSEPLPRLHVDGHLYSPLLLGETNVDSKGQELLDFRESLVRSTPTGLVKSEIKFLRDLREFWAVHHAEAGWADCKIYLLRNLPRRGVGFFQTAGFYPDFLLWLKKGDAQALAFIEPHGMVIWDQKKVDLLAHIRGLGLSIPTIAYIVTETSPRSVGAFDGKAVTEEWLRERYILFQGSDGYVGDIMLDLRRALESVLAGQFSEGGEVGLLRQASVEVVSDDEVSEEEHFTSHLPVYSLKAAAGHFGAGEAVDREGWVRVDGRLREEMFVAQAVGKSMEPRIADGDLCVFRQYRAGTRQGMIVLAQWSGDADPETGFSYAVKEYHRIGTRGAEDLRIELRSLNPEFDPIVLTPEFVDDVAVVAEFVEVIRPPRRADG